MQINVKLEGNSTMPSKAYEFDAGFDLYAAEDFTVPAGGSYTTDTGVHMAIPEGYCGLIVSKSGLNVKNGLTSTGLVDSQFTGSIRIKLYNADLGRDYAFTKGMKISQIVILPIPAVELVQVDELEERGRGNNGFGSSGA